MEHPPLWMLAGAFLLSVLVILGFAWLIPAGRWGADEFGNFAGLRSYGRLYIPLRLTWSPRPFSECLLALYGVLCLVTKKALIGPVLAALWLGLGVALWRASRRTLPALVFVAVLFALFVSGHPTGEMFFTPIVAIAYIPTIAAFAYLTLKETTGPALSPTGLALALCIAAWSSEAGAIAVLCVLPPIALAAGRKYRVACAAALVCALGVLTVVLSHRVAERPVGLASAFLALSRQAVPDLISIDGRSGWFALLAGFTSKAAFVAGTRALLTPRFLPGLAAGLAAGSCGIELAALMQGGDCSCGRYETLRQCLYFLALLAVCGAGKPTPNPARGAVLLAAAILVPALWSLPNLRADWSDRTALIKATAHTWQSGLAPGSAMVFSVGPPSRVVGMTATWPEGTFKRGSQFWPADGVLNYFEKTTVTFQR